jgi:ABC-type glycerol-3-phosphate transport system substrate-binding protein
VGWPDFGDKAAVEVIAFLGDISREGALAPGTFSKTGAERIDEFARGTLAMMTASSRDIQTLRKKMGDSIFGVTNIPGSPGEGKSNIALSGIYAGISEKCTRQDEAWTFLSFLAEKSPVLAAQLGAVPGGHQDIFPGAGTFSDEYLKEDPLYSKVQDVFEASKIVPGFAGNPRGEEFDRIVREELRVFFEQGRSAADTAAVIQKRWDS